MFLESYRFVSRNEEAKALLVANIRDMHVVILLQNSIMSYDLCPTIRLVRAGVRIRKKSTVQ